MAYPIKNSCRPGENDYWQQSIEEELQRIISRNIEYKRCKEGMFTI